MSTLTNPYSEISSWTYLDNSWLATQTLGNAAVTTYTYNPLGQLMDLANRTAGGVLLSQYGSMLHDAVGNRTSLTASLPAAPSFGGLMAYQYDTKDQLTQEQSTRNGGYVSGFGYDAAGNATSWKGVPKTYNTNNQDTVNGYDGAGNPLVYQGVGMNYDPENRLTTVGSSLAAGYTGENMRAWKQVATGISYFLYDGQVPVLEMDGGGNIVAVNTFGTYGLVSRRVSGSSVFYTFDPQGSVAQRLDAGGAVLTSFVFDAHGVGLSSTPVNDPYGYKARLGYYTDVETGLLLLTQRYYDPGAGRFLTRDPIGYAGGVNLYCYGTNSPLSKADPSGLEAQWVQTGAGNNTEQIWGYHHAFMRFVGGRTPCAGKSFGFWAAWLSVIGPGNVQSPDPAEEDDKQTVMDSSKNATFESFLCKCILASQKNPPPYTIVYACGSWVKEMWNCGWNDYWKSKIPKN
ncbi:MAG: RHS repeat-associated core domain-containing protein [Actinomycetota bacterium]